MTELSLTNDASPAVLTETNERTAESNSRTALPSDHMLIVAWFVAAELSIWILYSRMQTSLTDRAIPASLLDLDTVFPLIVLTPFFWCMTDRLLGKLLPGWMAAALAGVHSYQLRVPRAVMHVAIISVLLLVQWVGSENAGRQQVSVGRSFDEAGPYMHDEFSYLFQAETFLSGRWSFPSSPVAPEIFHATHILNDGRFGSRYPPGTGLYLAAFVGWTTGVMAMRVAHLLVCAMLYRIGYRIGGSLAGFLSGLVFALSANQAVLSNVVVAHGPALIGLTLFLDGYLTLVMRPLAGTQSFDAERHRGAVFQAGCGLAMAMLCRPMTAAGFCFPFGVHWLSQAFLGPANRWSATALSMPERFRQWMFQSIVGFGLPLVAAFGLLAWQSDAIIGTTTTLAYSRYTELYTPRHVYGFGNGDAKSIGDEANVLHNYDSWPINLTLSSGLQVAWERLKASLSWTFGTVPLTTVFLIVVLAWRRIPVFVRLLTAALVTLQIAHIPYWLSGTLDHHYIFETILCWSLMTGLVFANLVRNRIRRGHSLFAVWVVLLFVHQGVASQISVARFGHQSLVQQGAIMIGYFSPVYEAFLEALEEIPEDERALVIVRQAPEHMHVEFTRSRPPFNARILIGRERFDRYPPKQLQRLFPDRQLYIYDSQANRLSHISSSPQLGERAHPDG